MELELEEEEERVCYDYVTPAAALLTKLHHMYGLLSPAPRTRRTLHLRIRRSFHATTDSLKEQEFRSSFRMNRSNFAKLVSLVRPVISKNEKMGALRNGAIEPEVRVAIVLRIMAGAADLDLMVLWQVARSTIYQIFHETSEAIANALPMESFPDCEIRCANLSMGFSSSRGNSNPLQGCIGALDGIAVRISKPRPSDCINPASYYHRKGYYAIPVQAICDSKYRFTFFSAKCAGPTHDSVAFEVSSFAENLRNGLLPNGYWIAADDAYVSDETIITPLPISQSATGTHGDAFNFYQSSLRMHIEQAFGIMMARWGILWRPL